MFNNNAGDGADFCEAYKSQILDTGVKEKKSSLGIFSKILTILLLLIIIVVVSIYGYIYVIDNNVTTEETLTPPVSVQTIDDEELVVSEEVEEPQILSPQAQTEAKSAEKTTQLEESDIDKIAKDVKKAISNDESDKKVKKAEEKVEKPKKIEKLLEVPTANSEAVYLEELAKLSQEIDKDRK